MTRVIIKYYLYFIVLYFASCTPKMVEIKPSEDPVVTTDKKEPKGPCVAFDDLLPHEKETAENAYVLYKDFMKVKNYKEAMHYWKIAYAMAPGSNGRAKNHFEDGASLYKQLHDGTTDMVLKRKYIDTIMSIYDMKKKCFGDEAYINGLKAFDYYYNYPGYIDDESIYNLFKSNFDIKGKNADYFVVNPFTKMLYDRIVDGKVSHEEGRKYADLIFQTVEHGLATCKGKICEAWQVIDEYAPSRLEGLEGIDGFYNCGYYTKKYYPMYKANMDSCDIINLVYARLLRGDCLPTDANIMELKAVKATKCYVAPPALSCAAQAYEDYSQGKYSSAIQSYESCIDKAK